MTTNATVTLPADKADYLAGCFAGNHSAPDAEPAVDGTVIVTLTPEHLDYLGGLSEDEDGHYDGAHIWIGGTEHLVWTDADLLAALDRIGADAAAADTVITEALRRSVPRGVFSVSEIARRTHRDRSGVNARRDKLAAKAQQRDAR